jgi:hypothetical protein
VFVAIAVLLPLIGVALRPALGLRGMLLGALLGLMPLMLIAVCGVHEVGHVIGGLLSRFRFAGLFVGPLSIARDGTRLRMQPNSSWSLVGGMAICVPPPGSIRDSRSALAFLAGGPLASVLFGAALLALHFAFGLDEVTRRTIDAGRHTVPEFLIGATTFIGGVCSLLVTVVTLIPNRVGGFTSDGAALRMLWQRGADANSWLTTMALMGDAFDGVRPRNWPEERVALIAAIDPSSPMASGCHAMALLAAFDRSDRDAVRHHLAQLQAALHKAPAVAQASVRLDEAWHALGEGRVADARTAYDAGASGFVEQYVRCRVHAGVLHAEGHVERAREEAREGLRRLDEAPKPYPGLVIFEREMLVALAEGRKVPTVWPDSPAARSAIGTT